MEKLQKTYKDTMFPNGKELKPLLNRSFTTYYPEIIFENKDDGSWNLSQTKTNSFKLDNEGSVTAGSLGGFATANIVKPNDISLKAFYSDPKILMDYFLKAINISPKYTLAYVGF